MFSATETQFGTIGTMPAAETDLGTTAAYVTVVTKIFFSPCALVAYAALHADGIVTLGTVFSAIGTQFGAVFTMSAKTNDSTIRTQKTFDTKIRFAPCALHAKTAAFTYFFVTFVAMLSTLFANQSTVFTMVATGANDRAIRTQITSITKIFFPSGAIIAHTAVTAELIVTLRTMFVAFRTEFGAPFASFAAS